MAKKKKAKRKTSRPRTLNDMPFHKSTYVAFSDLCGFKNLMKNRKRAYSALDYLFNSVYRIQQHNPNMKALAISDSVIAWVDGNERNDLLNHVIEYASSLHKRMLEKNYLMTTTIAWGDFHYDENRLQLSNLSKTMLIGGAYLTAFLANNKAPEGSIVLLDKGRGNVEHPTYWSDRWLKSKSPAGWEYFWSSSNPEQSKRIIKERKKAEGLKYDRLKEIYSGNF